MLKKTITSTLIVLAFAVLVFSPAVLADDEWIEINTVADMFLIRKSPSANFKLNADINMDGIEWTPIPFNGTFDGSEHTIYNLDLNTLSEKTYVTIDGNHKAYDTRFATLFSHTNRAVIKNLNLVNVEADIDTDEHCFVSGIVGYSLDSRVINCHVTGRMNLTCSNIMCGIGGIVGFGTGFVENSSADITAVYIDKNPKSNSEEFIGGIFACGYPSFENCSAKIDAYANTLSYTHNGAIIGMHHVHNKKIEHYGFLTGCTADFRLHLYEHDNHWHQHNEAFVGEALHWDIATRKSNIINYEKILYDDFSTPLLPCSCDNADYIEKVIHPTCAKWGWSEFTCESCSYTYLDNYTSPAHTPSKFETAIEPTYDDLGLMVKRCTVCGELLEQKEVEKLIYVELLTLYQKDVNINYKTKFKMNVEVSPQDAYNTNVVWSSSDTDVAKVDNDGNVEAVGRGTAAITCTSSDGNASAQCTVNVKYTFWQWVIVIVLFGWAWY